MDEALEHETILSLLSVAHNLANLHNRPYCLTRSYHVLPEQQVLRKRGYNAILEVCTPHKKTGAFKTYD